MDEKQQNNQPPAPEGARAGEQDAEQGQEKRYVVRHNKQDVPLTFEELCKNAEKGLDYDRIRPSHDFVKELAAKSGEQDLARFIDRVRGGVIGADDTESAAPARREERENIRLDEAKEVGLEFPDYVVDGALVLPEDAGALKKAGMGALEACRAAQLRRTEQLCRALSAKLDALEANRQNSASSIGSLSGGEAAPQAYCSPQQWDRLPKREKEKLIRSGKIYDFMKKWSGKE